MERQTVRGELLIEATNGRRERMEVSVRGEAMHDEGKVEDFGKRMCAGARAGGRRGYVQAVAPVATRARTQAKRRSGAMMQDFVFV